MKTTVVVREVNSAKLKIIEKESVAPARNQVRVRWHATSLNYHDFLVAKGLIPVPDGRVPMSDGAGEIIEIGEDVSKWKTGDRVMSLFFPEWLDGEAKPDKLGAISGETADGFICEESCISEDALTTIPDSYSFGEAACLPCAGLTAWHALIEIGECRMAEKVLIEGSGGMSIFALQFARSHGAQVFATSGTPSKHEKLRELGAVDVVNYRTDEHWGKTVFSLAGQGVDHALDVGGGSTMKQTIESVRIGGHIYSIGILGNGRKGEITFPKLFFKFVTLHGLAVGNRDMQQNMVKYINRTGMKPVIDKRFGFDQLEDAFNYQESGKHFGKIVVEW